VFAAYRKGLNPDRLRLLDRFTMKDLAFKAVGVGSVGTFCCVGLFLTGDNEPLFLQVKQAQNSVLERLGGKLGYKGHQGRRVVQGQQMMQAASDIFLGATQDEDSGRQFYIRTLKNRRLAASAKSAKEKRSRITPGYVAVPSRAPTHDLAIPPQLPATRARARHSTMRSLRSRWPMPTRPSSITPLL